MGVLMSSRKVDEDQAFRMMNSVSQRTHRKVREVAEDVIFTGALEEPRLDHEG